MSSPQPSEAFRPAPPAGKFTFSTLPLSSGKTFGPVTLAYESWGRLNLRGATGILVFRNSGGL
jgi:hypothetical protein